MNPGWSGRILAGGFCSSRSAATCPRTDITHCFTSSTFPAGRTDLDTASRPNLDGCAGDGVVGLSVLVLPGITPGSGPGHLGLFGYDPLEYRIGRGILEALGINFAVGAKDVAIRGNFCTLGADGKITDRRAGR